MKVKPVGYYNKRWGGGIYITDGLPDMQIVVKGYCLEIELKAENGRVKETQKCIIQQINNAGGCGLVAYPKDFELIKTKIKEIIDYGRNY